VHQGALQLNGLDICLFLSKTRDLLDGETLRGLLFYYTACNLRHIHGSSWIHLMLMSTTAFLPTVWLFLQRFVAYTGNNMRKASPSPDPRERNKEVWDFCFCFHRGPGSICSVYVLTPQSMTLLFLVLFLLKTTVSYCSFAIVAILVDFQNIRSSIFFIRCRIVSETVNYP
jgi:hypothetical protein